MVDDGVDKDAEIETLKREVLELQYRMKDESERYEVIGFTMKVDLLFFLEPVGRRRGDAPAATQGDARGDRKSFKQWQRKRRLHKGP